MAIDALIGLAVGDQTGASDGSGYCRCPGPRRWKHAAEWTVRSLSQALRARRRHYRRYRSDHGRITGALIIRHFVKEPS